MYNAYIHVGMHDVALACVVGIIIMSFSSKPSRKGNIIQKLLAAVCVMVVLVAGIAYILRTKDDYILKTNRMLSEQSRVAVSFISLSDFRDMFSQDENISNRARARLESELYYFSNSMDEVGYAYVAEIVGDNHTILADSISDNNFEVIGRQDGLGTADAVIIDYMQMPQSLIEGPFISAMSGSDAVIRVTTPIIDNSESSHYLVYEYDSEAYYSEINQHVFHAIVIVASVLILVLCLIWFIFKNIELAERNQKIKAREKLFRAIFRRAPVGVALMYENRIVAGVNPAFESILNRTEAELKEVAWEDLTFVDDYEAENELIEKFRSRELDDYEIEKRFVRPDGDAVWCIVRIIRFELKGREDISHLCMIQNIDQRKKAEKAFEESERSKSVLLSHLPGMAYRCANDIEWTMHFVSDGCRELTGFQASELIDNQSVAFNDLIAVEYQDRIRQEWERILPIRAPFHAEYEIVTKQGAHKWVLEMGQGVYDESGEVVALEGIIIDMTARKKQEERIRYLNDHDFLTGLYNRQFFEKEKMRMDKLKYMPITFMLCDINGLRLINDAFGQNIGDAIIIETARFLEQYCSENDVIARTGGNEFSMLLPNTSAEDAYSLCTKIQSNIEMRNQTVGEMAIDMSVSIGYSTKVSHASSFSDVVREATEYMYKRKLLNRKSSHSAIVSSIMTTLYERSQETENHAIRLAEISKAIARRFDLNQSNLDDLELFAMLHDIGKVGIDDRILNKPGKLDDEEWTIMKKHPEIGYRIAMSTPDLERIAEYILSHHERWDGHGYPRGLKGEEIPLPARILAVADTYDAMTEDRVYRKGMSREIAIEEILRNRGTQFDPDVADLFVEALQEYEQSQRETS